MKIFPYTKEPYDNGLKMMLDNIKQHIETLNDDKQLLITGDPGSGKSSLGLQIQDYYQGELASIRFWGFTRGSYAEALYQAAHAPKPRFCCFDEANVSKRDSLSQFNKDLITLFMSVRGANIFHIWNNPSVDILDKQFIRERIHAIILVRGKWNDRPRHYYYFKVENILKILEKYKKIDIKVLGKVRKKYAAYRGWFRNYNGKLLPEYMKHKENRIMEVIDQFREKYANDTAELPTRAEAARKLGCSMDSIKRHAARLTAKGLLEEGKHYIMTAVGKQKFTEAGLELMKGNMNIYRRPNPKSLYGHGKNRKVRL